MASPRRSTRRSTTRSTNTVSTSTNTVSRQLAKKKVENAKKTARTPISGGSGGRGVRDSSSTRAGPSSAVWKTTGTSSTPSAKDSSPVVNDNNKIKSPAMKRARPTAVVAPNATAKESQSKNNNGNSSNNSNAEWKLNAFGIPECPLPCREPQFDEIWTFLKDNIQEKTSRCLYVSGVPGTGKTVIVQSVVNTLARLAAEREKKLQFNHVYINGLSLGSPDRIWKRFYLGLHNDKIKITPQTALKKLEAYFETKTNRLPVILIVDELDQLLDKQQSILYRLLEWSSHPSTMFSLVAIFNTMNLPENVLALRNTSRIGFSRVVFPPYTHGELQTIVKNSLASTTKLNSDAIMLLSRKVAALSGDARRALEIAKRAVEIVESGNGSGVKAVDEAFKEIFSSPKIDTVKDCTLLEQMFLKTVSSELQRTGSEETTLMNVQTNIFTASAYEGIKWSVDQVLSAASRLLSMKLIIAENDSPSLHKRISLNIPMEDINYALGIQVNSQEQ